MNVIINNPDGTSQTSNLYESIEFTLTNGVTDYNLDTQQVTFKSVITLPAYCNIYTSKNISIKFDSTSNHAISLTADTSTEFSRQSFNNIFLTNNSGNDATVRIYVK